MFEYLISILLLITLFSHVRYRRLSERTHDDLLTIEKLEIVSGVQGWFVCENSFKTLQGHELTRRQAFKVAFCGYNLEVLS